MYLPRSYFRMEENIFKWSDWQEINLKKKKKKRKEPQSKNGQKTWQTSMLHSNIVLLIYVNETIYLYGNLPFFKIYVNHFMAQDDHLVPGLSWRRKQPEQAPSWKQDSILGRLWTLSYMPMNMSMKMTYQLENQTSSHPGLIPRLSVT